MVFPKNIINKSLAKATGILMSSFGPQIKSQEKESQSSIVTELDYEVEATISRIISSKYPGHSIIGEEKGGVFTGSEYTWVIDPLDGTSNYAAGIPWFGTLIALFRKDIPVAAGACLPYFKMYYYAEPGKGTFCNGNPIHVSSESSLKNVLFAFSTDYSGDYTRTENEMAGLSRIIKNTRNIRSTNSLIDFCYVADGRFGGCINHYTRIWDIAAPWLIIREAGGIMCDLEGKDIQFELSMDNYNKNYSVMASSRNLAEELFNTLNLPDKENKK
jgi:myo-inositol-1(or 4)-monophosphatase